jgi:hypothetical protein
VRHLKVEASSSEHPKLNVRTRTSYVFSDSGTASSATESR